MPISHKQLTRNTNSDHDVLATRRLSSFLGRMSSSTLLSMSSKPDILLRSAYSGRYDTTPTQYISLPVPPFNPILPGLLFKVLFMNLIWSLWKTFRELSHPLCSESLYLAIRSLGLPERGMTIGYPLSSHPKRSTMLAMSWAALP